jgi:hypothetical protein
VLSLRAAEKRRAVNLAADLCLKLFSSRFLAYNTSKVKFHLGKINEEPKTKNQSPKRGANNAAD